MHAQGAEPDSLPDLFGASEKLRRLVLALQVLLPLAAALPIAGIAAFGWLTYDQALESAERLVVRTVDVLHEHTLKVFETQELILDRASSLVAGLSWPEISARPEIDLALKALEDGRRQVASIWVLDSEGYVRAGSAWWSPGLNGADRDYFKAHVTGRDVGTFLGKSFRGRMTGEPSFGFSRARRSREGSFDGVVSISVSADYFADSFREIAPETAHVAALLRTDGEILARDPRPEGERPALAPDDPLMAALRSAERGVIWRVSPVDGVRRLVGYRTVEGYPLVVAFAIDRAAALQSWWTNFAVFSALTGGAGLAVFLLAAMMLAQARSEHAALARLAEERARRAAVEGQLRQSQKLETLGKLTGSVAHDFNNLLSVIMGNLSLIEERPTSPTTRERAAKALFAATRGERLVRSLLAFARRQSLRLSVFDLDRAIREIEGLLEDALGPKRKLVLSLCDGVWPVLADLSQVEMAILNLVVNARDATPEGGTVEIRTANVTLHGEHEGLVGDFVALGVADDGIGMTPEVLQQAFEPYFTTKPAGEGNGLGLPTIYGFARQCGGGVTIRSRPGAGTTVTIYLPRAAGPCPGIDGAVSDGDKAAEGVAAAEARGCSAQTGKSGAPIGSIRGGD